MAQQESADLLQGVKAIAEYLGMTRRRIHHLIDTADLPAFKVGGRVCARKATLSEWLSKLEIQGCSK